MEYPYWCEACGLLALPSRSEHALMCGLFQRSPLTRTDQGRVSQPLPSLQSRPVIRTVAEHILESVAEKTAWIKVKHYVQPHIILEVGAPSIQHMMRETLFKVHHCWKSQELGPALLSPYRVQVLHGSTKWVGMCSAPMDNKSFKYFLEESMAIAVVPNCSKFEYEDVLRKIDNCVQPEDFIKLWLHPFFMSVGQRAMYPCEHHVLFHLLEKQLFNLGWDLAYINWASTSKYRKKTYKLRKAAYLLSETEKVYKHNDKKKKDKLGQPVSTIPDDISGELILCRHIINHLESLHSVLQLYSILLVVFGPIFNIKLFDFMFSEIVDIDFFSLCTSKLPSWNGP